MNFEFYQKIVGSTFMLKHNHCCPLLLYVNEVEISQYLDDSLYPISIGNAIFDTLRSCHILQIVNACLNAPIYFSILWIFRKFIENFLEATENIVSQKFIFKNEHRHFIRSEKLNTNCTYVISLGVKIFVFDILIVGCITMC